MSKRVKRDVDCITTKDTDDKSFFGNYISARKPVKLSNKNESNKIIFDYTKLTPDIIVEKLDYKEPLLVEKKYKNGFGNGNKREKMTLSQLMEKFNDGADEFYLTTQYAEHDEHDGEDEEEEDEEDGDDDDDDEDNYELDVQLENELPESLKIKPSVEEEFPEGSDSEEFDFDNVRDDYESDEDSPSSEIDEARVRELFQPPLTNICKELSVKVPLFSTLVPQQINLWMGLVDPKKLPLEEEVLTQNADVGSLGKFIPGPGTSSGLHHDHSDNLYVLLSGRKRFTIFSPFEAEKLHTIGNIENIFPNGVINYKRDSFAPNWIHMRDDGSLDGEFEKPVETELDPPNFSKIPPVFLHLDEIENDEIREKLMKMRDSQFPELIDLQKYEIWLNPGDMLYLPAGWFHEVSSFGDESSIHMALNYWFAPPNNDKFETPYKSSFWVDDLAETLSHVEKFQK